MKVGFGVMFGLVCSLAGSVSVLSQNVVQMGVVVPDDSVQVQDADTLVDLQEVLVTAANTRHLVDGDEYLVTPEMRGRAADVTELLGLLPEVRVNRMSGSLLVNNRGNVLLLVNGKGHALEYIKSIDKERIVRVKVIKHPTGRYVSEGYEAVIDIKVRDYEGLDVSLANFLIVNPNNNGSDKVMMEQPSAGFTFTQKRVSLFGTYAYGNSKWNTPYSQAVEVPTVYRMDADGKEAYRYHGNVANLGLNYRVATNHELSLELDYRHEDASNDLGLTDSAAERVQEVTNKTATPVYGSSLFYKGQFADRVDVYSELAYSYLKNNVQNSMVSVPLADEDYSVAVGERRDEVKYTADVAWQASDPLALKGGYRLDWKRYDGDGGFHYTDARNKFWAYLSYEPSDAFSAEVGAAVEWERMKQRGEQGHHYVRVLPSAKLDYAPSDNVNFNLSYVADGDYPTLAMLNPVTTALNPYVYSQGNPSLKPAVTHKLALENSFFDVFTLGLQFEADKNRIASLAAWDGEDVLFSYQNTALKRLSVPLNFDYDIGDCFNVSAEGAYYVAWAKQGALKRTTDGWWYGVDVTYFNNGYMVDLGYNRSIEKENLLQGYGHTGIDSWTLTASKQWCGGKLSTMLTWFLPVDWGLSKSIKTVRETEGYRESTIERLKPYRNAILLNVSYRFKSGKSKQSRKQSVIEAEERVSGGFKY